MPYKSNKRKSLLKISTKEITNLTSTLTKITTTVTILTPIISIIIITKTNTININTIIIIISQIKTITQIFATGITTTNTIRHRYQTTIQYLQSGRKNFSNW
jgi:hypothetical protein